MTICFGKDKDQSSSSTFRKKQEWDLQDCLYTTQVQQESLSFPSLVGSNHSTDSEQGGELQGLLTFQFPVEYSQIIDWQTNQDKLAWKENQFVMECCHKTY